MVGGGTCGIGEGVGGANGGASRADREPRIVGGDGGDRDGEGGAGGRVGGGVGSGGELVQERSESISEGRVGREEGGKVSGVKDAVGRGERGLGRGGVKGGRHGEGEGVEGEGAEGMKWRSAWGTNCEGEGVRPGWGRWGGESKEARRRKGGLRVYEKDGRQGEGRGLK